MTTKTPLRLAALAGCLAFTMASNAVHAQGGPGPESMVRFGGSMQAVAELCGDYSEAELETMKRKQMAIAAQWDISAEQFEKLCRAGVAETRAKIDSGTPAQRAQACEQLETQMP